MSSKTNLFIEIVYFVLIVMYDMKIVFYPVSYVVQLSEKNKVGR